MALITSPLDITGCQLWLDANQGVLDQFGNPVTASGTSIGTWRDQSGNNNHVSSSSGTRPTYITNIRTSPEKYSNTIRFGGNGLLAAGDVLSLGTNHALLFAVIKNTVAPTFNVQHIMSKSRPGSVGRYFLSRTSPADTIIANGLLGLVHSNGNMNTTLSNTCSDYTIVCWNVLRTQSVNGPMRMRANRFQNSTDAGGGDNGFNATLSSRFCIGGSNDSTGFADNSDPEYYFNGDICECGVYLRNTPYNNYEIKQLEGYLYNKWFSSNNPVVFNLRTWLDASDSSTLYQEAAKTTPVTTNAQPIGCWADKTANQNNFVNFITTGVTTASRPTYYTSSFHGYPSVWFNGTQFLTLNATSVNTEQSTFIVQTGRSLASSSGGRIYTQVGTITQADTTNNAANYRVAEHLNSLNTRSAMRNSIVFGQVAVPALSSFVVLSQRARDIQGTNVTNGLSIVNYAATSFGTAVSSVCSRIGANLNGSTGAPAVGTFYDGEISEVLVYDRFVTEEERHQIEFYLASKWNIPLANFTYPVYNGNWSNNATWYSNDVPGLSSRVYANGYQVTIDQNITVNTLQTAPYVTFPYLSDGGMFLLNQPYTLNVSGSTTAINHRLFNVIAGSAVCLNMNVNSGVVYLTGNVCSGTALSAYGIIQKGTAPIIIDGNVVGNREIALRNLAGTSITITGTLTGGGNDDAYGLYNTSPFCNITVLSSVRGGTSTRCAGISSTSTGNLVVSGGIFANTGLSACGVYSESTHNIFVTGNILGSTQTNTFGLRTLSANNIEIFGNVAGGSGRFAVGMSVDYFNNLSVTGNISGSSGFNSKGIVGLSASGSVNIVGNIRGGSSTDADGLTCPVVTTLTISGDNILGGTSSSQGVYAPLTDSIKIYGNIVGGSVSGVRAISANRVEVIGNILGSSYSGLYLDSTNSASITGNITGTTADDSDIGAFHALTATDVRIVGNVSGGTAAFCYGVNIKNLLQTFTLSGNLSGGTNATASGMILEGYHSNYISTVALSSNNIVGRTGPAFVNMLMYGNIYVFSPFVLGGTGTVGYAIHNANTGLNANLFLYGNLIGTASPALYVVNEQGPVTINGDIDGGSVTTTLPTVNIIGDTSVKVTGIVRASTNQSAIWSSSQSSMVDITGPIVNASNGRQAVWARTYFQDASNYNQYITHFNDAGSQIVFYAPEAYHSTLIPNASSVAFGVKYAEMSQLSGKPFVNINELTGTMIVPSASSVSFGVPVGIELGKIKLLKEDFIAALNTDLSQNIQNTFGEKIKNICTKQVLLSSAVKLTGATF